MSKLLLHIGPHKTGSTYIQKFFFENTERLQALGVHYPHTGLTGQFGQHELVEKIKALEAEPLAHYLADFIGPDTTFISSENFDRLKAADVARLAQALAEVLGAPTDVRILFYHRNYADLLPSWWQEEVKHGAVLSFYEFVLPHVLRPFASHLVNPALVLDLYAQVFGKESLNVVDYDRARDELLLPIFSLLGIDPGPAQNEIINSSLQVELVEVLRALNSIARARDEWHFHKTRALFLRKMRDPEIGGELQELVALIRKHMKPLRIGGGFFEKSVSAAFRAKYEGRYFNRPSDSSAERELSVAGDGWLLTGAPLCERIYEHVMSGDVSY
jgi:hypothetical protein